MFYCDIYFTAPAVKDDMKTITDTESDSTSELSVTVYYSKSSALQYFTIKRRSQMIAGAQLTSVRYEPSELTYTKKRHPSK